ncbi:MAG TPA: hypothetical protein VI702_01410 [Nitrospiria bacterium]
MKITLAVLADYANITREGKLNIMGIFDAIHAQGFPFTHPLMQLVLRFEAGVSDEAIPRKAEVRLMDADGKRLFVLEGNLTPGQARPGEPIRSDQIISISMLKFEHPGDYEFKVLINDSIKAEVPLKVVAARPSA